MSVSPVQPADVFIEFQAPPALGTSFASVSPAHFAEVCVQTQSPAALLRALEKFDISKADFVASSGYSEQVVDAWFQTGGINLNEYLGAGKNDWGMEEVLAASGGRTQSEVRGWILDNLDDPMLLAQSSLKCGSSAEVIADIVGCGASEVTAYFANAGLGEYFAYFS